MSDWRTKSLDFEEAPYHFEYATIHDLIEASRGKEHSLIVALDHITDVGNFGAIIRSAEVVGATGVIIPNKRAAQVNETVYRTSAGAVEYLKVAREANISQSIARLKHEGFWVGAASVDAKTSLWNAPLEGRLVVVMGAEDTGISRLVRESCDFEFALPQRGFTQSLNVAQTFAVIAYEWMRHISI